MKILFLTENFPPETNAAATRVYERARYWVDWGHQVTVVTCAPNFPQGRLHPGFENEWRRVDDMDGIKVVRVKTFIAPNRGFLPRTLDFLSFLVTGTIGALREAPCDVVVATSPQFFAAVAGWLVGLLKRTPFVFELGDLWPASISAVGAMKKGLVFRALEKLELFLYRRSAAVAALTPSFKRNLVSRGIDAGKISVVMNGVDLTRYAPGEADEALASKLGVAGAFVIGYVGTHGMAHGLGNVLDAAELLPEDSRVRFMLVGDGAERNGLIADARRRGLDKVIFVPPQPKAAMPAIWKLCDVALIHLKNSPVFADVIPSKIFEAMAMGRPLLLAAPVGEASGIVLEENAGLVIAPEDPVALASAAMRLADDRGLVEKLAVQSLAAAPRHSRERQAREMLAVLEQAIISGAR